MLSFFLSLMLYVIFIFTIVSLGINKHSVYDTQKLINSLNLYKEYSISFMNKLRDRI